MEIVKFSVKSEILSSMVGNIDSSNFSFLFMISNISIFDNMMRKMFFNILIYFSLALELF